MRICARRWCSASSAGWRASAPCRDWPALAWSLAAGLAGPLFTAGSIAGQVSSAEAGTAEGLAVYQQTILNAFRETNDALTGTVKKRQESAAQKSRVASI